jgi:hypothetical protein
VYEYLGTITIALIPAFILLDMFVQKRQYNTTRLWNWLWRAGHQMHHSAEGLDVGFYKGASVRLIDMLFGRDVSEPKEGRLRHDSNNEAKPVLDNITSLMSVYGKSYLYHRK